MGFGGVKRWGMLKVIIWGGNANHKGGGGNFNGEGGRGGVPTM